MSSMPRAEPDKMDQKIKHKFLTSQAYLLPFIAQEIKMETNHNSPVLVQQTRYKCRSSKERQVRLNIMMHITFR